MLDLVQRRLHRCLVAWNGLLSISRPEAARIRHRGLPVVPYGNDESMIDAPLGVCRALRNRDCTSTTTGR
jgi:hypothetical protein